jgi:hypothetical protein
MGVDKSIIFSPKIVGKSLYKHLCPEFVLHSWKQWEDLVMILASMQEMQLIRKVKTIIIRAATSSSSKLQQACTDKLHFILERPA